MKEDQLDKIENKIDILSAHLSNIDVTLAAQHVSLDDHIRRTELIEADLAPIKSHVSQVQGAIRLIGFVAIVLGILHYLGRL